MSKELIKKLSNIIKEAKDIYPDVDEKIYKKHSAKNMINKDDSLKVDKTEKNESKINEEVSNWKQHQQGLAMANKYIELTIPIFVPDELDLELVAFIFQNKKDAEFKFGYDLSAYSGADITLLSEGSSDYLSEIIDLCLGAIKEFDENNNTNIIYDVKPLEPSQNDINFLKSENEIIESKVNEIEKENYKGYTIYNTEKDTVFVNKINNGYSIWSFGNIVKNPKEIIDNIEEYENEGGSTFVNTKEELKKELSEFGITESVSKKIFDKSLSESKNKSMTIEWSYENPDQYDPLGRIYNKLIITKEQDGTFSWNETDNLEHGQGFKSAVDAFDNAVYSGEFPLEDYDDFEIEATVKDVEKFFNNVSESKINEEIKGNNLNSKWVIRAWMDNMNTEDGYDEIEFTKIGLIDFINQEEEEYYGDSYDYQTEPIEYDITDEELKTAINDNVFAWVFGDTASVVSIDDKSVNENYDKDYEEEYYQLLKSDPKIYNIELLKYDKNYLTQKAGHMTDKDVAELNATIRRLKEIQNKNESKINKNKRGNKMNEGVTKSNYNEIIKTLSDTLANAAKENPDAHLVKNYQATTGSTGVYFDEGLHFRGKGAITRAIAVSEKLQKAMKKYDFKVFKYDSMSYQLGNDKATNIISFGMEVQGSNGATAGYYIVRDNLKFLESKMDEELFFDESLNEISDETVYRAAAKSHDRVMKSRATNDPEFDKNLDKYDSLMNKGLRREWKKAGLKDPRGMSAKQLGKVWDKDYTPVADKFHKNVRDNLKLDAFGMSKKNESKVNLEDEANKIGNDKKLLLKRLKDGLSVLKNEYKKEFKDYEYDFENKALHSKTSDLSLIWKNNGRTSEGSVSLYKNKGENKMPKVNENKINEALDSKIKIFLTNLGKYNEGDLVGEWVELPVDDFQPILDRIGINDEYEEWFITDYEAPFEIGEYDNIDELNEIAEAIENFTETELEVLKTYEENGYDMQTAIEKVRDNDYFYLQASNEEDLAYAYIESIGNLDDAVSKEDQERYFDYESFGRDLVLGGDYSYVQDVVDLNEFADKDTAEMVFGEYGEDKPSEEDLNKYRQWIEIYNNYDESQEEQLAEQGIEVFMSQIYVDEVGYDVETLEQIVNEEYETKTGYQDNEGYIVEVYSERELAEHIVDDIYGSVSELGENTLQTYFDYEAFGRDLSYDFYQTDNGYVQLN